MDAAAPQLRELDAVGGNNMPHEACSAARGTSMTIVEASAGKRKREADDESEAAAKRARNEALIGYYERLIAELKAELNEPKG